MPVGEDITPLGRVYTDHSIAMLDRAGPVVGLGQFLKHKVDGANVLTCTAKEDYEPVAGDFVTWDKSLNYGVQKCKSGDAPIGRVTVVRGPEDFDVALYTPGSRDRFPYSGTKPNLGAKVEVGAKDTEIRGSATGGAGTIIGVDVVPNTVDVLF